MTGSVFAAIGSIWIVGFMLGLLGGGGSILATPLLLYVAGVAQPDVAIGTGVGGKLGQVVDAFPELLDIDDAFADRGSGTGFPLQVLSLRELVGMRMSVEDSLDRQAIPLI